nr:hypothetical protein [Tanacetum cinerariifolium]
MATNEETSAAGSDTRPPMLVESDYDSWKIRIVSDAKNVSTEASAATSDQIAMIDILNNLTSQVAGHAKTNQEITLENETLKNELVRCKQEIGRLDTQTIKLDLENQ